MMIKPNANILIYTVYNLILCISNMLMLLCKILLHWFYIIVTQPEWFFNYKSISMLVLMGRSKCNFFHCEFTSCKNYLHNLAFMIQVDMDTQFVNNFHDLNNSLNFFGVPKCRPLQFISISYFLNISTNFFSMII